MNCISRNFLLLLILATGLFASTAIFAQNSKLTVTILDDSGKPVTGAKISLKGPDKRDSTESTDDSGIIIFSKLADGSYTISVSADGYEPRTGKIAVEASEKTDYKAPFKLKGSPKPEPKVEEKPKTDTTKIIYYDKTPEAGKPDEVLPPAETMKAQAKENIIKAPPLPEPEFKTKPVVVSEEPEKEVMPQEENKSTKLKIILVSGIVITGIVAFVFLTLLAMMWKKSGKGGKIVLALGTLGCGCLCIILIIIAVVLLFVARKAYDISKPLPPTTTESTP